MMSRTSPVGVVVLVLASLLVVGCSPGTAAVFNALTAAGATASSSTGGAPDAGSDPVWWPHPDGYALTLPAGWAGIALDGNGTDRLVTAIADSYPGAASRIRAVLVTTRSRVSAVAAQVVGPGVVSPIMVIVAQPTEGNKAHGVKTRVQEEITALPGLQGSPARYDVRLPAGSGVRFEYTVVDGDLGSLKVFSYLFRFGSQAYLISFVASADVLDDEIEAAFESIVQSLRFGV